MRTSWRQIPLVFGIGAASTAKSRPVDNVRMLETLLRICALQPAYSPSNTEAMQNRGRLIRQTLPAEVRMMSSELGAALGQFGGELDIGASDGIGLKTEAPWVWIFASSMSPTPRAGFYVVIHFAADGSAIFITIGCGSTIWANGDLRPVSDAELKRRTDWARSIYGRRLERYYHSTTRSFLERRPRCRELLRKRPLWHAA